MAYILCSLILKMPLFLQTDFKQYLFNFANGGPMVMALGWGSVGCGLKPHQKPPGNLQDPRLLQKSNIYSQQY